MAYGDGVNNGFGLTQDLYGNWVPLSGGTTLQGSSPTLQSAPVAVGGSQTGLYGSLGTGVLGASTTTAPAPDPYAQWGGQAKFNAYQGQYNSGLSNIQGGAADAFGGARTNLQGNAENLFNSLRTGQQGIDTSRANNELNRMNGIQDILGYVRNGMRQGVSRLSNGNALESSAAGALNGAYSQLGNQKSRSVNNQAAMQGNSINQNQNELNTSRTNGLTDFHRTRDNLVSTIGSDLRGKLAALDQQAIGLSLPDRINVDQEKQRLINEGQSQLQEVDNWLNGQLATVNPQSQDQVQASANNLRTLGTGAPNPFNTGTMGGQQLQGPAIDQLPIFTSYKKRQ